MIQGLEKLLNSTDLIIINDVYNLFEKTNDILIIKYDGVREFKKYNVIIIGKESRFETINFEVENLQEGIKKALIEYKKNM